jgi:hypothetical protein
MNQGNVRSLENRQAADASEYERLSRQLYALMDEWEALRARQRELESQFVENDLVVKAGSRKGRPLSRRRRAERLAELLELNLRTDYLQRALSWTEQRRNRLLKRQTERSSIRR